MSRTEVSEISSFGANLSLSFRVPAEPQTIQLSGRVSLRVMETLAMAATPSGFLAGMTLVVKSPNVTHHWAGGDDCPLETGPAAGSSACDSSVASASPIARPISLPSVSQYSPR